MDAVKRIQHMLVEDYLITPVVALDLAERVVQIVAEEDGRYLNTVLREIIVEVAS